ncbi:TcpE family conjugal transfer membrane protein [Moorella sp. E306M]|uniref:TcpE family conjugal transfer membrane protein n=1 Tax=Moorella sp. E306M TaxID=2572683 RepID=UPI00155B1C1C|nr:TcpE family conjugal transfer membrane protein [Moorella sp. E306M]
MDDARVFSSYRSLFNIKYKIYNLGDWTLPFPMPLDALVVFSALIVPAGFVAKPLAFLLGMPTLAAALALDVALTYLLMQWDPQGKMLPVFLAEVLAFFVRPKKRAFGGGVLWLKKERVKWEMEDIS